VPIAAKKFVKAFALSDISNLLNNQIYINSDLILFFGLLLSGF